MSLQELVRNPSITLDAVAAHLDGLTPEERLAECRTLNRNDQRSLYDLARGARLLTLDDFVPKGTGPSVEVIHHGRNTLPLFGSWRLFQKRMCRPEDGSARLFGYNESPFVGTIGPGFFVVVPTAGNAAWEERGAIVVDYFQVPDGPVAAGWPAVVPNDKGLSVFVYNKTRDFMRGVSAHVTIGAAYKEEKALDHYFILCRQPLA